MSEPTPEIPLDLPVPDDGPPAPQDPDFIPEDTGE